ncbi:MAG: hypothetical protein ACRDH6_00270 [Actinomycetota bacterium]
MRITKLLFAGLFTLTACGGASPVQPADDPPDPAVERTAAIYATVIRQVTTTSDSTFGKHPNFPVIYVVDRIDPRSGDPEDLKKKGEPISEDVKEAILEELADLPVEFISDEDEVVTPVEEGGGVEENGVVVTVGEITGDENRVEVGTSLYAGPLAGTWLTYEVQGAGTDWEVTGTIGPIAIS